MLGVVEPATAQHRTTTTVAETAQRPKVRGIKITVREQSREVLPQEVRGERERTISDVWYGYNSASSDSSESF
jgi:hypothetical protein